MRRCTILLALALSSASAQTPDLDTFVRELDLSVLREPTVTPPPEARAHPADLRSGRQSAPAAPLPPDAPPEGGEPAPVLLEIHAGPHLVVPNPGRVDDGWKLLGQAVEAGSLEPDGPLLVVLHADNKFSVACPIRRDTARPLPLGADISPHPPLRLLGLWTTLAEARRDHPEVIRAFQTIRQLAGNRNLRLDTRELYFLPGEEDKVLFALRVVSPD